MTNRLQLVAVQATKKAYYGLTHQPSGSPLDEEGKGIWPRDHFTFRLREEGSIELLDEEAAEARATAAKDNAEIKPHEEALKAVEGDKRAAPAKK